MNFHKRQRTRLLIVIVFILLGVLTVLGYSIWLVAAQMANGEQVTVETATPEPSATPVVCTSIPPGMSLDVNPLPPSKVEIHVEGLLEGEVPVVLLQLLNTPGHFYQLEETAAQPVGREGIYETVLPVSTPPFSNSTLWKVAIIHARGVACLDFEMPVSKQE
jgi:hypothetical protein